MKQPTLTNTGHAINSRSAALSQKAAPFHIRPLETTPDIPDECCTLLEGTPQRSSQFELIWVKKGSGSLVVDFEEYPLSENAIYCLSPGQIRQLKTGNRLEGYHLSMSGDFYFTIKGQLDYSFFFDRFSNGKNIAVLIPSSERLYELDDIVILLQKEYLRNALSHPDLLSGLLKIFMLYLSRELPVAHESPRRGSETGKVMEFLSLVKKNFLNKKMVADYASDMALTPNYLNFVVKKISGFSASYHIQQCIILEAKRQAAAENRRLKEVANNLGFNDSAHFSKFFKNNCGVNFTSFRNSL